MKHFPHYIQYDAMDCGPTCLRMVAAFYGKCYSLEGLREKSFITREGVSMLGISEAAEKIGFRSICVQVGYEKLQEAPLPCIIHWNQQHFVVVYKLNDKHVWVADPGAGKLKYTKEEFCNCWLSSRKNEEDTGVALLLEPTPEFYTIEDEGDEVNRRGFSFLYSYLRPYRGLVGQLLLGLLLGSMIQLMLPFLTQSVVDFGINNQNLGFIYLVLIAQLMLFQQQCRRFHTGLDIATSGHTHQHRPHIRLPYQTDEDAYQLLRQQNDRRHPATHQRPQAHTGFPDGK